MQRIFVTKRKIPFLKRSSVSLLSADDVILDNMYGTEMTS